jgi:hypothetical protein
MKRDNHASRTVKKEKDACCNVTVHQLLSGGTLRANAKLALAAKSKRQEYFYCSLK